MKLENVKPLELIDKLEKRCFQHAGGLVVISGDQWEAIWDAYHSPLVERIAQSALLVCPVRDSKTRELSFETYCYRQ